MDIEQFERLQKLTQIELTDLEKPVFQQYFDGMKEMFDGFLKGYVDKTILQGDHLLESSLPPSTKGYDKISFTSLQEADADLILENVLPERLYNRAIEVSAVF